MTTFSQRLTKAMLARDTNPNALSKKCGISQSTIKRIKDGTTIDPQRHVLVQLARHLPCNPIWLQTGHGTMDDPSTTYAHRAEQDLPHFNVSPFRGLTQAPIIDWGESEMRAKTSSDDAAWATKPMEWTQVVTASARAFWLRVVGDLMVQAREPSYPHGTLICVDPAVAPERDRLVLARDPHTGRPIFRKLVTDGANWYLVPLNSQYASTLIDSVEASVIGVCVEYKPPGGAM